MPENEKTFGDFFDEALKEDEGIKTDDVVIEKTDEVDDQQTTDTVDDQTDQTTQVDDTTHQEPDPVEDWEVKYNQAMAENQKLEHKMASWEGRIKKANTDAAEAQAQVAELMAKDTGAITSPEADDDDDDTVLKEFREEFPDLVKPVKALAKKYAKSMVNESLGKVTPQIEQIKKTQDVSEEQRFLAPIYTAHQDWRSIYDSGKLQLWIDTKSPLQQKVFNTIVTEGSQDEVIDMFTTYKKENGISKDKPTGKAESGVDSIISVPAHSAGPPADGKVDKDDYDSGWKDAMKEG